MNRQKFEKFLEDIFTDPFEKQIFEQEKKHKQGIDELYLSLFTKEFAEPFNNEHDKNVQEIKN